MQARGIQADVVTCCSLINALERGGQWQLAEQLFVQMCAASWQRQGTHSPLYRMMEIAASAAEEGNPLPPPGTHTAVVTAPQSWSPTYTHPSVGPSSQTISHPSTPRARLVRPLLEASPAQSSLDMDAQTDNLQQHTLASYSNQSPSLLRRPPGRHVSDLQHQVSNLYSEHSLGNLQSSLSTPDVTNFNTSLSRQHSTLSAGGRLRSSEASLSSLLSQGSPFKLAPETPEKPSRPQQQQSDDLSRLMQDFAGMEVQSPYPSNSAVSHQIDDSTRDGQTQPYSAPASPLSHATAKQIQEAALHRQDALSLRPTTNPVGVGQAPVLRFMNVTQIAPNRVCCNALLAAYARAKPTQWQKVCDLLSSSLPSATHRVNTYTCMHCFSDKLQVCMVCTAI